MRTPGSARRAGTSGRVKTPLAGLSLPGCRGGPRFSTGRGVVPIRGRNIRPGLRLRMGDSLLTAAAVVDTSLVSRSLGRFRREHGRYVAAQRKVAAVERDLGVARARRLECKRG